MMGWHVGMGGWGPGLMVVIWVLFWAAGVTCVVLVARSATATPRTPAPDQVLARRFARGEIGEDEYRSRLSVLREK